MQHCVFITITLILITTLITKTHCVAQLRQQQFRRSYGRKPRRDMIFWPRAGGHGYGGRPRSMGGLNEVACQLFSMLNCSPRAPAEPHEAASLTGMKYHLEKLISEVRRCENRVPRP